MTERPPSDDDDDVGYRRPPKAHRFRPGVSGNSRGRPRKRESAKDVLKRILDRQTEVSINGKRQKMTHREACLLGLVAKALKGDVRAHQLINEMDGQSSENLESLEGILDLLDDPSEET